MVNQTALSKQQGTAKKLKQFAGLVRDEWTFTSAVTDEYYDFLQEVDCLQILTKAEAKEKLKTRRVIDSDFCWAIQGIDPATNKPGMLQVKIGGTPKYLTPTGGNPDAVFLPLHEGEEWKTAIERTHQVVFTEGAKKAACLIGLTRIPTVSLTGVTNWEPETQKGKQRPFMKWLWETVKELNAEVLIAFDMDAHTNENVKREIVKIKRFCEEQGIPCRVLEWSIAYKGIDDYTASIDSEEDQKKALREVLQSNFPISSWEKQFKPSDSKGDDPESIAEELIDDFRQNYKFHREQSTWRTWNGKYWKALKLDQMKTIVLSAGKTKGLKFKKINHLGDVVDFLRFGGLAQDEWIAQPRERFINFNNGIYDIESGDLLPHQPGYNFTSCLDREYKQVIASKEEKLEELLGLYCPVFFYNYLDQFNDDVSKVLKLVAVINALLTYQCYDLQFFLHLQGKPGSGKGTFLRLLTEAVGENNTVSLNLKDLNSDYHKARAVPSQLVLCSDEDKQSGEYKGLKAITGGDLISFRPIFKEPGEDYFRGLLVVTSNNPIFAGDTTGLDRRLCLIKFDKSFKKLNKSFETAMMKELDSLISIALMMSKENVKAYLKEESGSSTKYDRWMHKVELCSIASFMEQIIAPAAMDCMEQVSGEKSLYAQYRQHCGENGQSAANSQTFSRRLGEHLDFLEWEYDKKSKARINGSTYPVPVVKGIASKITHSGFEGEPTISERLLGTGNHNYVHGADAVADDLGGVADTCADVCADEKPFKNKGCADVADVFSNPPIVFESGANADIESFIGKAGGPDISATPAQVSQDKAFIPAQMSAQIPAQTSATSATDELTGWDKYNEQRPYPNLKSDNVRSSQKRALEIREAYRAAKTKENLKALRRENGGKFSQDELTWVMNWLKFEFRSEYDHVGNTARISQPTITGLDA